jgi:hypothetical protein
MLLGARRKRAAAIRRLNPLLAIVGWAVPYCFFVSFLVERGLDIPLFFRQVIADDISSLFAADLAIAAAVLVVRISRESQRRLMANRGIYVPATLLIGPSFSLPQFLDARESQTSRPTPESRGQASRAQ